MILVSSMALYHSDGSCRHLARRCRRPLVTCEWGVEQVWRLPDLPEGSSLRVGTMRVSEHVFVCQYTLQNMVRTWGGLLKAYGSLRRADLIAKSAR